MLLLTLIIATFKVQQFEPEFYLLIATLALIKLRIIITGNKRLFISSF